MRRTWLFIALFFAAGSFLQAHEHIIVSGGPALRYFEKHKVASHDRFWGNFINTAAIKIRQIKPDLLPGDFITWMVYSPGYITRGKEEGRDFIAIIKKRAKELGVKLIWFNDRREFLNHLNQEREEHNLIARLEYFGHSNKRNWMFDYSNRLDGAAVEPATLHIRNFRKLQRDVFTKKPFLKSWGCHSGEEYSAAWYRRTRRKMIGAVGKTDYSNGGLPFLSTKGGKWTD